MSTAVDSALEQSEKLSTTNGTSSISVPISEVFKPPPLAPIFEPTMEEFQDFYGYLESIAPIVTQTGICKIRPPKDWNLPFAIDVGTFRFRPRVQRLNELEAESRVKLNFLDQLAKFWDLQGVRLRVPNVDRRQLDLHRLYTDVKQVGGYQQVTNSKLWPKVASLMGYKQPGKSLASQLKYHYQKILLPFDLLKSGGSQVAKPAVGKSLERQASAPVSNASATETGRNHRSGRALRQAAAAADDARRLQLWSSPTKRPPTPPPPPLTQAGQTPSATVATSTKKTKRSGGGGGEGEECPEWLDSLLCRECRRGDQESVLLICEGCEAPYHTFCLYPPLPDVPPGDWRCPKCVSETIASAPRPAEYGFEQSRTEYSLAEFGAMADKFKRDYFQTLLSTDSPASLDQVEAEFWRLLQALSEPVSVEYGADIHSSVCGTGFPTRSLLASPLFNKLSAKQAAEWRAYAQHCWNLNNLPLGDAGLLRFLQQDINGMVIPWCYVGMLFSAFCWHIEDHWSYSINYLHWGDPKTWYGVPSASAPALESAMREEAGELFERSPDLLHHITTIMNPAKLVAKGVPVYRLDQEAGDFVITFPRAYHAGFNQGFNFAEAVNFCSPSWLPMGRECVEKYIEVRRPCVFSHEELVCNMADEIDQLTADQAEYLLEELKVLQQRLAELNETAASIGITDSRREEFDKLPDDDRQCSVCNTTLYICGVQCRCQRRRLVCARHPDELLCSNKDCRQRADCHSLVYRYSSSELLAMTQPVSDRCRKLDEWRRQVDAVLTPPSTTGVSSTSLPDKSTLETLEQNGVELRVSQSCARLRRLRGVLRMADRAAGVLRLLLRPPEPGAGRITEAAFGALAAKLAELPCRLAEAEEFQRLRDRLDAWRSRARQLLLAKPADALAASVTADSVAALLAEADDSLPVAMDDAGALSILGRRLAWKSSARIALGVADKKSSPPSLAELQLLLDEAADNDDEPDDAEFVDLSAKLTSLHHRASRLCLAIRECLEPDRQPQPDVAELTRLVEAGQEIPVRLEPLQRVVDLLDKVANWEARAAGALAADLKDVEQRPSLEELERLAADGRDLGVRLDRLAQLEALIGQAHAWLERASRNFLKKQSPHSLLQVLLPRSAESFQFGPPERHSLHQQQQQHQQHKKSAQSSSASSAGSGCSALKSAGDDDPSRRFSAECSDADRVAAYRDLASRELQAALAARRRNDAAGDCYCGRQLPASVCFLQCELCRLWLHAGCAPLPKYLKPFGTGGSALRAALREIKYLCPACERGRRPRMENLLSLLLVLQPLPVRLVPGAALQCLTERAMAWQSRVHSALLGSAELRSALVAVVKAMKIQLPDRLNRQLGDDFGASSAAMSSSLAIDDPAAADTVDRKPRRKSPLFPRGGSGGGGSPYGSGVGGGGGGGGGGGPSAVDSFRRPRLTLPAAARAKLESLMLEGDLLEVAMEETTWLWHLLQASAEEEDAGDEESGEVGEVAENDGFESDNEIENQDENGDDCSSIRANSDSGTKRQPASTTKRSRVRIGGQRTDASPPPPPEKRRRNDNRRLASNGKTKRKSKIKDDVGIDEEVEEDEESKCSAGAGCVQPTGGQVNWVQCDRCSEWYHWLCVGVRSRAELVGSYYCAQCLHRPASGKQQQQQQQPAATARGRKSSAASSGKA